MRLVHAVVKRSCRRVRLHDLRSTYFADLSETALAALESALRDPAPQQAPVREMISALDRRGLLEHGPGAALPIRGGSDLVSIEIEPIGRCNLACRHCFVEFSRATMTERIFRTVLDGATALGAVEVTLNGGEPLLHPRCLDWLEAIRERGFRALLFTNATRVTQADARRMADAGVANVTASLDGFRDDHDALRGAGAFDRAVRGIRALVSAGLSVYTTTMVRSDNLHRLEPFLAFCRDDLGVRATRLSPVLPIGKAASEPDLALSQRSFREFFDEAARAGSPLPRTGWLPCRAGVDKLFVSAGGIVYPCHLFERPEAVLGDLASTSLEALYDGVRSSPPAEWLRRFDAERLDECTGCPAVEECSGGCRARALAIRGGVWRADPIACLRRGFSDRIGLGQDQA